MAVDIPRLEDLPKMKGRRVLLRADSGFAREALMVWCDENRVGYVFELARNERRVAAIEAELPAAAAAPAAVHAELPLAAAAAVEAPSDAIDLLARIESGELDVAAAGQFLRGVS